MSNETAAHVWNSGKIKSTHEHGFVRRSGIKILVGVTAVAALVGLHNGSDYSEGGIASERVAAASQINGVENKLYIFEPGTIIRFTPRIDDPTDATDGNIARRLDTEHFPWLTNKDEYLVVRAGYELADKPDWRGFITPRAAQEVADNDSTFAQRIVYVDLGEAQRQKNVIELDEKPLTYPRFIDMDSFSAMFDGNRVRVDVDGHKVVPGLVGVGQIVDQKTMCSIVYAFSGAGSQLAACA